MAAIANEIGINLIAIKNDPQNTWLAVI